MLQHCVIFASVHLLALAVSTYIAAIEIETILVSGVVCSLTGIASGIAAVVNRRPILALVSGVAPLLAVTLCVLEAFYWNWGPHRAAAPFTIIFLINQAVTTIVVLVQLRLIVRRPEVSQSQITLRTLMMSTATFAAIFALARFLTERQSHTWLMAYALGFLGLTVAGLGIVLLSAWRNRQPPASAQTAPGGAVDVLDS